jgi:hypothetical protein
VFLQFGEVLEGIGAVQFAGADQTHVQIAHLGAILGPTKERVFPTTEIFP